MIFRMEIRTSPQRCEGETGLACVNSVSFLKSVADSIDYAVTRLILDDYERAVEIMEQSPFKTFETDIIGVELPDSDQPFLEICTALLRGEVNLQYAYPLLYNKGGRKAIAVYVDDIDAGIQILQDRDITLLTEGDLDGDGEFY
jgi:hypothetical protein